jgi:hypothetical protein
MRLHRSLRKRRKERIGQQRRQKVQLQVQRVLLLLQAERQTTCRPELFQLFGMFGQIFDGDFEEMLPFIDLQNGLDKQLQPLEYRLVFIVFVGIEADAAKK